MTKPGTQGPDPNATIQLDALEALDQVLLPDEPSSTAEAEGGAPRARLTPPPLPMGPAQQPPQAGPRASGKTLTYGLIFLALLAGAIAAGVGVGMVARGNRGVAPVASSPPTPTVEAKTTPSASAAPHVLTMPTVELGGGP
jgi:hypothetical protein